MTLNIVHKNSVANTGGSADAPTASDLEFGEVAVNYAAADPALFVKDSSSNVVRVSEGPETVTTSKIAGSAVTTGKIASNAVTNAKLANDSVRTAEIQDDSVTTSKIQNDAVTTVKLLDANVTPAKLDRTYVESTAANTVSSLTSTGDINFSGRLTGKDSGTDKIQMEDGDVWISNKINIGDSSLNGLSSTGGNLYSVSSTSYAGYFEARQHYGALYCNAYGHTGSDSCYALYARSQQSSSNASAGALAYSINNSVYALMGYWSTSAYYGLYTNGAVAGTSFPNVSDERLKDLQGTPENCLDKLSTLNGYYYTWKDNSQELRANGPGVNLGLSAQEVQAVFPEVITENVHLEIAGENPETLNEQLGTTISVDYGKLVPALIEAIKELKVKVETLESTIQTTS